MKQVRNVKVTFPCGCKIVEKGHDTGKAQALYDDIEYCPKHEAAQDMYEALKAIIDEHALTKTDPLSEQILKTLAKAEGKE